MDYPDDAPYNAKEKELERLTRKYNRMLSEFNLICKK
jgi:hypothetical protein